PARDERRRLDPGLFAGRRLLHLDVESAPLAPTKVHPKQHLGPVLRVRAPCAAVYRHDGVTCVVPSAKQPFLLQSLELLLDVVQLLGELGLKRLFAVVQLDQGLEIVHLRLELAETFEPAPGPAVLCGDARRALAVLPEAGSLHLALEALDLKL